MLTCNSYCFFIYPGISKFKKVKKPIFYVLTSMHMTQPADNTREGKCNAMAII
jgi:hypothetical protein